MNVLTELIIIAMASIRDSLASKAHSKPKVLAKHRCGRSRLLMVSPALVHLCRCHPLCCPLWFLGLVDLRRITSNFWVALVCRKRVCSSCSPASGASQYLCLYTHFFKGHMPRPLKSIERLCWLQWTLDQALTEWDYWLRWYFIFLVANKKRLVLSCKHYVYGRSHV